MIDQRIANLAKRIDEEKPPPVLMRRWIRELLKEMLEEKDRYLPGVSEFSAPVIPGGARMYHLCDLEAEVSYYSRRMQRISRLARKGDDCPQCRGIYQIAAGDPVAGEN